jgi:hypothetical protein
MNTHGDPPQNAFWVPSASGRFRLILVTHDESVFLSKRLPKDPLDC